MEDNKKGTEKQNGKAEVWIAIVKSVENVLMKMIDCYLALKMQKKGTTTPEP